MKTIKVYVQTEMVEWYCKKFGFASILCPDCEDRISISLDEVVEKKRIECDHCYASIELAGVTESEIAEAKRVAAAEKEKGEE
jgi:hypothetical protein